ncbi:MAG: hypothetical protein FWD77_07745 [Betaproteobacteria bacterium]|nr:hypothetical protein [Betaproteobacteria bacterium]
MEAPNRRKGDKKSALRAASNNGFYYQSGKTGTPPCAGSGARGKEDPVRKEWAAFQETTAILQAKQKANFLNLLKECFATVKSFRAKLL